MRRGAQLMVVWFLLSGGLLAWTAAASAEVSSREANGGASSLGSSLVVPGLEALDGGQQMLEQQEAQWHSPEAAARRRASQRAYERLDAVKARALAGAAFPAEINKPAGGPPQLPPGQRITGFPTDHAASVNLGEGRHGVIESAAPIAVETAPGRRTPIDLRLSDVGSAFQAQSPAVEVRIPRRLSDGVQLPTVGVSLTPIDAQGRGLAGSEGTLDGASVLYANTQTDTDTVIKPATVGFAADTLLRSVESPEQLSFQIGMPQGAHLARAREGSGAAQVLREGTVMASVLPPSARDATGRSVPVSMAVSGNTVTVTVHHRSAEYQYPIAVDPTVTSRGLGTTAEDLANWLFYNGSGPKFVGYTQEEGERLHIKNSGPLTKEEWAYFYYTTKGESQVYSFTSSKVEAESTGGGTEADGELFIDSEGKGIEGAKVFLPRTGTVEATVCALPACAVPSTIEAGRAGNGAFFEMFAETSGSKFFEDTMFFPTASIVQYKGPTAAFDTSDQYVEGLIYSNFKWVWASVPNPLYGAGRWVQPSRERLVGLEATDPGIGVFTSRSKSPTSPEWQPYATLPGCRNVQCEPCVGAHCSPSAPISDPLYSLVDGEDPIEWTAYDATGMSATATATIKIDGSAPHNIALTGLPAGNEVSDAQTQLTLGASAIDGSGSTPSSGVASLALAVDGREVGSPSGSCPRGPCEASAQWTLNAEEYGAGQHTITVTATDNAGNVAHQEFPLTVHHASPVAMGPGSVNPATGEFNLNATDVSAAATGSALTVTRSYGSRHLTQGAEGPLGPQWSLSLGAEEKLTELPNGSILLVGSSNGLTTFTSNGKGGFESPKGDSSLLLSKVAQGEQTTAYLLRNLVAGTTTTFTKPGGVGGAAGWVPTVSEGPTATGTETYTYQTVEVEGKKITEPTEDLAPVPAGVSCAPKLERGCRALTFNYATSTSASGEGPSEWGDYVGRLTRVYFTAWDPAKGEMTTTTMAQYAYDAQGRLRAEWDPRISPALKTTYGYDAEGHITGLNPPGQQPWLLSYGTSEGDPNLGRLLSVTRPSASTALGAGLAPTNTVAPKLSSTKPVVGTKLSVSNNGTWTHVPLAYAYQWEDCNPSGGECAPIAGAVNKEYFPATADQGRTLVAQVRGANGAATVIAVSAATTPVAAGTPQNPAPAPPSPGTSAVWTIDYRVPTSGGSAPHAMGSKEVEAWAQTDDPTLATAIFPPDEPMGWPAGDYKRASVYYLDSHDRAVNVAAPSGAIATTEYNSNNDVVRTLSADNRAAALNEGGKSTEVAKLLDGQSTFNSEGSELQSALGPQHNVKLSSGAQAQARASTHYFYDEGAPSEGGPFHLVTKTTTGALVSGKEEDLRTTTTSYSGQNNLGWKLRKPTSTTTDPSGLKLVHSALYDSRTGDVTETRQPASGQPGEEPGYSPHLAFGTKGTGHGQFSSPYGIAVNAAHDVYVLDTKNNRVQEFDPEGKYLREFGTSGAGPGQLAEPRGIALDPSGNVWIADTENSRVEEFSSTGSYVTQLGTEGSEQEKLKRPMGLTVDAKGNIWVADGGVREYGAGPSHLLLQHFTSFNGDTGVTLGAAGIAIGPEGNIYTSDSGQDVVLELTSTGTGIRMFGTLNKPSAAKGQFNAQWGITVDPEGKLFVANKGDGRIEVFAANATFLENFGKTGKTEAQLKEPRDIALDPEGNAWIADTANNRVVEWKRNAGYAGPGSGTARNRQTIYYSSELNSFYPACGEHPEWAGLPCQVQPSKQPEGTLQKLPVTTYTYNVWDEPAKTTETAGESVRTTNASYDPAGRVLTSAISSSVGTALPAVTYEYSSETGAPTAQSTTTGGKTEKITSVLNSLGQLVSYTDADENSATYTYDVDGRLEKTNDGKGTQTYSYDSTTGELTKLVDSAAGTFSASYDPEGKLTSEGYPNGMSANYTYDRSGQAIGLEYLKTTHCGSNCVWYIDAVIPSVYGQWLSQLSSLSGQSYTYDAAGRLTQTQDTPTGEGCTTRVYAYEEDTNRTSLTTRAPAGEGKCATEGGAVEKHTYDEADRLNDIGVTSDGFGNTTAIPAADAGGSELTSSYYASDKLASQSQNGETIGYHPDPTGRTRETVASGKTSSDTISHYMGSGDSPAWTVETPSGRWTRDISDIGGGLAAVQINGEAPVLELANLHGDTIATAALSETETKLLSTNDTSEYGVPRPGVTPPKYSWLGVDERSTELPSGVVAMGARSYVPQLGRFLQTDPVAEGSANAYAYTFGDPVNRSDPSGESAEGTPPPWAIEAGRKVAEEAVERRAAEEAAARAEAERKVAEAVSAEAAYWAYWNNYAANSEASFWAKWNATIAAAQAEEAPGSQNLTDLIANNEDPYAGNCAHKKGCQRERKRAHEVEPGDQFCEAAGGPGLIGAVARSPIGIFVAVGCAAKGAVELAGGK